MENLVRILVLTTRKAHFSFLFPGITIINPAFSPELVTDAIEDRPGLVIIDGGMSETIFRNTFDNVTILIQQYTKSVLVVYDPPNPAPAGCHPSKSEKHLKDLVDKEKRKKH